MAPTPSAERKNPFLIRTLPKNMILQILHKTTVPSICRMRRTCSEMNEFVEENRKKLASRSQLGVFQVQILVKKKKVTLKVNEKETDIWLFDDNRLSSVSIYWMELDIIKGDPLLIEILINQLEKHKPACDIAEISVPNVSNENVLRILNSLGARQSQVLIEKEDNTQDLLPICEMSASPSKIVLGQFRAYTGNFDSLKYLHGSLMMGEIDPLDFLGLLSDIQTSDDVGSITMVTSYVSLGNGASCSDFPWVEKGILAERNLQLPNFEVLWKSDRTEDVPNTILMAKTGGKYLILSIRDELQRKNIHMDFENTLDDVLKQMVKSLKIKTLSLDRGNEFVKATVPRQAEILLDAVNGKWD